MKKKLFILLITIILGMTLFACSGCNKQLLDTNYEFNKAYIKIGDTWKDLEIKSWTDYEDGEQIQIILKDGTVILTNSFNCILYKGNLPK